MTSRVQSLPRLSAPLLASFALHMGILVSFYTPHASRPLPIGHWIEMAPQQSAVARTRKTVAPVEKSSPLDAPFENKKAETAAAPAPAVGKTAQAVGPSGPLGDVHGVQVSVRERYLFELENFINRDKPYPARARHLGMSGLVKVAFHLNQDGEITDPHVVRPCIHDVLNRAAVELVSNVGRFRPIPPELGLAVLHVTVPIQYELN